jgi:NAD-dependent deacetylase
MQPGEPFEKSIETLAEMISKARYCVALTGAGVSTLSGIRDFRGKNGLYKEMDAEKIFDIDYFIQDPSFYYKAAGSFIYNLREKEASIVHRTLAKLERLGFLKAVITQNIDLLHQKGGSRRVIEIHGSPSVHYCRNCSDPRRVEELAAYRTCEFLHQGGEKIPDSEAAYGVCEVEFCDKSQNSLSKGLKPDKLLAAAKSGESLEGDDLLSFDEAAALVLAGELPRCRRCGAVLKPAITFFGESLPVGALRDAEAAAKSADLMLVLGTSLTVHPAAGLPEVTIRSKGKIVIVNNMATPLDHYAVLGFDDLESDFIALDSLYNG